MFKVMLLNMLIMIFMVGLVKKELGDPGVRWDGGKMGRRRLYSN